MSNFSPFANFKKEDIAPNTDGQYIAVAPSNYGSYVVKISQDNGNTWSTATLGNPVYDVSISSTGQYMLATAYNHYKIRSTDYGTTWAQTGTNSGWMFGAVAGNGKYQTTAEYGNTQQTSSDYGANWNDRNSTGTWRKCQINYNGQYQIVAANTFLRKSTDYGVTISAIISAAALESFEWVAISNSGQYMGAASYGSNGKVYLSSNYGVNWTTITGLTGGNWNGIGMSSSGKYITVAKDGGTIYTSSDYGATWTSRNSNRAWKNVAVSGTGQYQIAGVVNSYVYMSSDYGVTWTAKTALGTGSWNGISINRAEYDPDPLASKGFTTEWTVSGDAAGRTITLPTLTGYTYDYYVDWGDGSAVQNIKTFSGGTHTYANDGTYWVEITGECPCWSQYDDAGTGYRTKITDIVTWGNPSKFNGFKFLYGAFRGCTNLKSFGKGKILDNGITSANALFLNCTGITSPIPAGLFDNCTGIRFDSTFSGCSNIVGAIPADLFRYNTIASNFASCFSGCNKITSIPADLFRYNTAVGASGFLGTFNGCTGITSIPADLFKYNVNVSTSGFRSTFASTSITEIPTDLFRYNTGVTTNAFYQTFYNCTGLTSIPTDLFRYNTLVSSSAFYGTFQSCTNLASIPTDLFKYNTAAAASGFYRTFYGTAITSIPTDLFRYNTGLTTNAFYQTFYNCNALTTLPTDIFRYNTAVSTTGFYQTFAYCDNLATVPVNLFKYNTSADSFYEAFINDTKLVVNKNIFYADGEQSTRFLNKSVDFRNCFSRTHFDGASQGTAPDLWACSFGTGTATSTGCYAGDGNNTTSLSNYASIPAAWK